MTFECMTGSRLLYFLEENKCLDQFQSGFRTPCSTIDHLLRLEAIFRDAVVWKQHCASVFFDLEKAYATWRYGILRYIANFLQGRSFRVQLGSTLSRPLIQDYVVPLSITDFVIQMSSISNVIPSSIRYSLHVDNIQASRCSSSNARCERKLQLTINKLARWLHENGFKFSPEKTVSGVFSKARGAFPEPTLKMDNFFSS